MSLHWPESENAAGADLDESEGRMAAASSIAWTDATWNPVVGCTKVSPGCAHCYAETMAARLAAMAVADHLACRDPGRKRHYLDVIDDRGRWNGRVVCVPEALSDPLKWRKPRMIFVNSMSDLFHEDVPDEFIDEVFAVMAFCPQHVFQLLTKRPERMRGYMHTRAYRAYNDVRLETEVFPPRNMWLGVSAERQPEADERIRLLLECPAAVRFVSAEPLLGPLDLALLSPIATGHRWCDSNAWLIIGVESNGPRVGRLGAFESEAAWWAGAADLVRQCRAAGVACYVKQGPVNGRVAHDPSEWPAGDWPREFPGEAQAAAQKVLAKG